MHPDHADELDRTRRQLLLFADDLQTMVEREKLRRTEVEQAYRELSKSYLRMVRTLAEVVDARDNQTRSHLDRTYQFAMALTRRVAPGLATRAEIGYGYLLHDIGKVGMPDAILKKPGSLTDDEWRVMRTHPIIGVTLVQPLHLMGDAVGILRSHHERWDGRGYPEGLRGEDIYLPARILMLADAFDAMTSDRSYRKALPIHVALEEIDTNAGTQFDPEMAKVWVALVEELERDGRPLSSLSG